MTRFLLSEQKIAEVVVAWLDRLGADVYQEVTISGGVADIVARVHAEIWIIEVKQTLRLSLITQAMDRRRLAHRVFIAAPHSRTIRDVQALCLELGIGLLDVYVGEAGWETSSFDYGAPRVEQLAESKRWNKRPVALASALEPEHKTHAKAGAIGAGGRWTPFRSTCEQLARVVTEQPGITLKAAIESIKHHYRTQSSARSSIAHWIAHGKIQGVRFEDGLLYPIAASTLHVERKESRT